MSAEQSLYEAGFSAVYDRPDPRAYFRALQPYDYAMPRYGADVCERLLREHPTTAPGTVLDLCCSYGVVGSLLRTDLGLDDLYAHYGSPELDPLPLDRLVEVDRTLFHEHRVADPPRVLGLDVATAAVDYALATGSLDSGFDDDLETDSPSPELARALADVDLIVTTGGVGYVTERTFGQLLRRCPSTAWVVSFCVRTYDYAPIEAALAAYGRRTERTGRTLRQRRFTGADEERWAISRAADRGLDPAGYEDTGYYYAELYVSRPSTDDSRSADELLSGLL